jgi:hypothetical protein
MTIGLTSLPPRSAVLALNAGWRSKLPGPASGRSHSGGPRAGAIWGGAVGSSQVDEDVVDRGRVGDEGDDAHLKRRGAGTRGERLHRCGRAAAPRRSGRRDAGPVWRRVGDWLPAAVSSRRLGRWQRCAVVSWARARRSNGGANVSFPQIDTQLSRNIDGRLRVRQRHVENRSAATSDRVHHQSRQKFLNRSGAISV